MPELPEVETIRRGLLEVCLGKKIAKVSVFCEKSFIGPREVLTGAEIVEFRRKGKALLVDLSNSITIMIHLRMTGQLIYRPAGPVVNETLSFAKKPLQNNVSLTPPAATGGGFAGGHPSDNFFDELPNKQTRVVLEFSDGARLFFNDQRKFGFFKVLPTEEVDEDKFIASLGPEPWEISGEKLYEKLQRHKNSSIKAVILDQKIIAGIGNIYADEALYFAKILPSRKAGEVSKDEAAKIVEGARKVMEASINSGGSTMKTYVKADGTKGDYLEKFAQVFRREGKECPRCGAEILKTKVAGRGTHYCSECQK